MKQETIEEATKNWITENSGIKLLLTPDFIRESFKSGAKWKAKNSYSEEEVYKIIQKLRLKLKSGVKQWQDDFEFDIEKWFKKNKKV